MSLTHYKIAPAAKLPSLHRCGRKKQAQWTPMWASLQARPHALHMQRNFKCRGCSILARQLVQILPRTDSDIREASLAAQVNNRGRSFVSMTRPNAHGRHHATVTVPWDWVLIFATVLHDNLLCRTLKTERKFCPFYVAKRSAVLCHFMFLSSHPLHRAVVMEHSIYCTPYFLCHIHVLSSFFFTCPQSQPLQYDHAFFLLISHPYKSTLTLHLGKYDIWNRPLPLV